MTTLPSRCSVSMTPALSPLGQFTLPNPGTDTERAEGIASCMSMSYMSAGATVVSTRPVICHCHVVPGLGFQIPDGRCGGGVGAGVGDENNEHAAPNMTSDAARTTTTVRL